MCKCYFETIFFKKRYFFAVLFSKLKDIFHEKKKRNYNIDYSSSLAYLVEVNWLYILCKVARKKSLL